MRNLPPVRGLAAVAATGLLAMTATGCGGGSHAAVKPVKANGCTATTTGHAGGRAVVTYTVAPGQPALASAVQQAAQTWNRVLSHVVLQPVTSVGTIEFVTSSKSTSTDPCTGSGRRSVTVHVNRHSISTGTNGHVPLANLLAREIGHALGLAKAGKCGALMSAACSNIPPSPDRAEIAEVDALYAAA